MDWQWNLEGEEEMLRCVDNYIWQWRGLIRGDLELGNGGGLGSWVTQLFAWKASVKKNPFEIHWLLQHSSFPAVLDQFLQGYITSSL